jgi:hypothetical protein
MSRSVRTFTLILAVLAIAAMFAPSALAGGVFGYTDNWSFESDPVEGKILAPWKRAHSTNGDRILCGDQVPHVVWGQCAFMFKGGAGERTTLSQQAHAIDIINQTLMHGPGEFGIRFAYHSENNASAVRAIAVVKYTMPGSDEVIVARSSMLVMGKSNGANQGWAEHQLDAPVEVPQGATVVKAKINFKNISLGGKLFIDEAQGLFMAAF